MVVSTRRYTIEESEQFIYLPENADRSFEFIAGEIAEVVANNYSSKIAGILFGELYIFLKGKNLEHLTGADGGYIVAGERYIPDVAYISAQRQPQPSREAFNPSPPDLAVEVLSPTYDPANLRIKIVNYLRAGTTVWVVDPDRRQVEVYAPDHAPITLTINDTLDGGDVLPGFTLPVKDIFPD
jgi:Uma2 family endonuclease